MKWLAELARSGGKALDERHSSQPLDGDASNARSGSQAFL